MVFLFIFLSLLLAMLLIIPNIPVRVAVTYWRKDKDDNLKIEVETLFGLIKYRAEISFVKIRRKLLTPVLDLRAEFFGAKGHKKDEEVKEEFGLRSFDLHTLLEKIKFLIRITDQYEAMEEVIKTYRHEEEHSKEVRVENPVIYRVLGMLFMGLKGDCLKMVWHTHYGVGDAAITAVLNGLVWSVKSTALSVLTLFCTFQQPPDIQVTPDFDKVGVDIRFESIFSARTGNIMRYGYRILLKEYKRRAKEKWPIIRLKP